MVNSHPITVTASDLRVSEYTVELAFGLKLPSNHPVDETLAIRLRAVHHDMVVKVHQAMRLSERSIERA